MSGWNEDNFLEKMMPLLEKKGSAASCPNAEILGAVADGVAPGAIRSAVAAHTAHCPSCAALLVRLAEFDYGTATAESEWRDTEQRLDWRMGEFLAAAPPPPPPPAPERFRWWRLTWMLAPIAAAAAVMLWLPRMTPRRSPVVARVESPVPSTFSQDKPAPGIASPKAATEPSQPTAGQTAAPAQPAESASPAAQPVETAAAEPHAAAPAASAAPEPSPEASPEPASPRSMAPGYAPVVATAGGQTPRPPAPLPPPAPASVPAYVRINAGTRVWILLQSTSPEPGGGFQFRGVVLLPVTQGGSVLLDRETRVVGTGKVDQGRTTIRIAEFVWNGTRYRLRGVPMAPARGPGSGPAIEFNAGQVLETWLATPSTYERVQAADAPQG